MLADRIRMSIHNEKKRDSKFIIIGDKDGMPASAIGECVKTIPAEVVFSVTEALTGFSYLSVDSQKGVLDAVETYDAKDIIVILGMSEAETAGLVAETVTAGDPTFAGPLAGVQLGLRVYHAFEPEFKESVDPDVYDEQIAMMEMVLDVDEIIEEVKSIRETYTVY